MTTKKIPFSKLSKAGQRVIIAKDTLKWLDAPNIKIQGGSYINVTNENKFILSDQANKNLDKLKCTVCAKGVLFLTHIDKFNNCSIGDLSCAGSDVIRKRLGEHFSDLQLDMIETAFERRVIEDKTRKLERKERKCNTSLADRCIAFGQFFCTSEERLAAILQNLIDNNGTFDPLN